VPSQCPAVLKTTRFLTKIYLTALEDVVYIEFGSLNYFKFKRGKTRTISYVFTNFGK
jgi:hypothetical protein